MRKKFETWILKEEFGADTFQSFVCWMLLAGTVLSFVTPAILILNQIANPQESCADGTFTILAHYRIHSWLYDMFEDFKNASTQDNLCFELLISDSQLDTSLKPTVWIPETLMWLDIAESSLSNSKDYVDNRTKDCTSLTDIPMGVVTWKSYSDALMNMGLTSPMDYNDFLELAKVGWNNYTNGDISANGFIFSHAHPNVTTSGVLGMVLGYLFQTNDTQTGVEFNSDDFEDSSYNATAIAKVLEYIEKNVHELGPNELSIITDFLGHGPDYIHASFGYENDVAYNNFQEMNLLNALWGDELAFIYFTSSFWVQHPICVMTGNAVSWMNGEEKTLAQEFRDYITKEDNLKQLLQYGIRPYNASSNDLSSENIFNSTYGVDVSITPDNTNILGFPDSDTVTWTREEWLDLKEPVYLRLLLDVSDGMQETVGGTETIWSYAIDGLEYFANVLEDDAIYDAQCFSGSIVSCGGSNEWPSNGTLGELRDDIIDFISDSMVVTQSADRAVYNSINETLSELRALKSSNDADGVYYNYVIFVITGDNSYGGSISAEDLLESVGINFDPKEVHIFPIFFRGSDDETRSTLEDVAHRTNGELYEVSSNMPDTLIEIGWYF